MKAIFFHIITVIFGVCINAGTREVGLSHDDISRHTISESLKKYVVSDAKNLAITNVRIIDGTGNAEKSGQTILIENGYFIRIGAKEEIKIPNGLEIINAAGKTIIPGMVGVHNHLHIPGFPFIGDVAVKLYLASGVTTIQSCGAALPDQEIALAQQIADGRHPGPDIVTSGPYFTGPGGNPGMIIPRDEKHIRDTIQYWIRQGVKWFKVYRHTTPDDLGVILDEAHRNGCKVTGHLCSITFEEATDLGIDGIEHGLNSASDFRINKDYGICNGDRTYMDELVISGPEVKSMQQHMIDNGVFLTSTLSIYETSVPQRAYADERTLKAMSPSLLNQYRENRNRHDRQTGEEIREHRLKRIMAFEYQFYKMGGLLGSGADAGRHNLPGYGDQRNFELLREAGFTTPEAIRIMTGNGARILNNENIGTIEPGKRADFVLLDGILEEDISAIRNVEMVFKNGIGYDPGTLIEETDGKVGM